MIMGDLISHHKVWRNISNNVNGIKFDESVNKPNYFILNEKLSTR